MFKCFFLSWLNVFALFNFSSSTTFMSIFTFVFDWLDFGLRPEIIQISFTCVFH